ncbi:type II toxin-antitoxin system VapC family toxin [Aquibium carbonis]|uniref:type II toxin-antitoxin system VapC family toxin n=1 Tax=Aquibium carbonis TaxID=2495581 RepID=UPI0014797458|nr:type II toxin-antitoxin system VapC family toxin [Aquibium carbonis]
MILIVDSSVAVKWFTNEPRNDIAKRIILLDAELIAPEWGLAEIGNALWRKVRRSELTFDQALEAIREVSRQLEWVRCTTATMVSALELGRRLDHSIYDCLFLALALERSDAKLITDDDKFAAKAASSGFGATVMKLGADPLE